MRSKLLSGVAAIALAACTVAASSAPASAQRWHWHGPGFGWGVAGLAAGVVGGAVAAATSPLWGPSYYGAWPGYGGGVYDYAPGYAYGPGYGYNDYGYGDYGYNAAPAVVVAPPAAVVAQGYGTRGNIAYCEARFRSYDPASGTYLGYDGIRIISLPMSLPIRRRSTSPDEIQRPDSSSDN